MGLAGLSGLAEAPKRFAGHVQGSPSHFTGRRAPRRQRPRPWATRCRKQLLLDLKMTSAFTDMVIQVAPYGLVMNRMLRRNQTSRLRIPLAVPSNAGYRGRFPFTFAWQI